MDFSELAVSGSPWALSRRFCTTDDANDLKRLCTEVIDCFVRESVGHDAAIKAILDDRLRRPQDAL